MKILYVDYYYEYGKKERGLNYIGIFGFEDGLKKIGHDVYHFYYDDFQDNFDILNDQLLKYAIEIKPKYIFFNLYTNHVYINTVKQLNIIARTINWFGDDPFLFDNFTSVYAPYFTYCITTDKFSLEKYKAINQNNVILSQWPANEVKINNSLIKNYQYDVSFIGAKNPVREWFVNELRDRGLNIALYGNGWENGPVTNEEMSTIFYNSKINLNISNSDIWDYRFLISGYCNIKTLLKTVFKYHLKRSKMLKKYFRLKIKGNVTFYGKTSSQIKARNFEIPSSFGFQLTDYVPSLEDYFIIGKEIACFSNIDEAEKQIRFYLNNNEERESIRKAGFERSINEYTYEKVLNRVFMNILKYENEKYICDK